ncbi:hypothetical protein BJX99DRAFT_261125 [Aspergillus californicus]
MDESPQDFTGDTISKSHPPALQHPTPDGGFRCGICNKTYNRRDLRNRHRRRCIKTIGQERLSKRKSCETCAQKKLRCSLSRPACTRCLRIGRQCQYPGSRNTVRWTDETAASASNSADLAGLATTIQPSLQNDLLGQYEIESTISVWSPFSVVNPDSMVDPLVRATFPNPDLMAPVSWNEEFSIPSHSIGQNQEILASGSTYADGSSLPLFPVDGLQSNLDSSDGANQSFNVSPYVDFNVDTSTQLLFGRDFFPKVGILPDDTQELYQQISSALREYPSLILQRDHWSPFIHHKMYRCSTGGMAKPLGVALACVSAHAGSVGSNHGFVDRLINEERKQLVQDFQSYLDTPENCLAAVHAVCIYQILGLFGDNFLPAAITPTGDVNSLDQRRVDCERQAELHNSFLLKMTRRLYEHYRDAIRTNHDDELNWERWKLSESLRRNIFFANTIILGARAGKLSSAYSEPLDDELVLDLPLPAPECIWRACSLREWLESRDHALRLLPELMEDSKTPLTQTLRQLLREEEAGRLDVSTLLPLTRIILASVKLRL